MSCEAERQRRRGGNKTKCLRWNQSCGESSRLRWYKEQRKVRTEEKCRKSETLWRRFVSLAVVAKVVREQSLLALQSSQASQVDLWW